MSVSRAHHPVALTALPAFGIRRHKEWRGRRFDPPEVALYGMQKVAKAELAGDNLTS
jgi:hypothetical protein